MRLAAALSAAVLLAATGAHAQAVGLVSEVRVTIGPELLDKTDTLGEREFDVLTRDLRNTVEARLGRAALLAPEGGVLSLTITDATPNRPTAEQWGRGLSMESYGIGGAEVLGEYIAPDGAITPVGYRWYESDIRDARTASTWTDAGRAFDRFAENLVRPDTYASR
jgi:hypothetical protein